MSYPKVLVDLEKIKENADIILQWCTEHGVSAAFVGKCVSADPIVINTVMARGFNIYADSREQNLMTVSPNFQRMLLRIAMPDRAEEIINCADISLQSEITTIRAIGEAAQRAKKKHKIILMIDLGDLREGILYYEKEKILQAARQIVSGPFLELYGVGTNLTCYGSIVPDQNNLGALVKITKWLRNELNFEIPIIAGGNSSSLGIMLRGEMPSEVNFLRLGEAVLLGTNTAESIKFPELHDDAFILEAELVEIQTKPSYPIGTQARNAFGEDVEYIDKGIMRRGILAIGRQDTLGDGLKPVDTNVYVQYASSDHLIVDLSNAPYYVVGDVVQFKLSYGALLAVFTSKYVDKDYT